MKHALFLIPLRFTCIFRAALQLLSFLLLFQVSLSFADVKFKLDVVTFGLGVPWGMTFIDEKQILFTERAGKLGLLNVDTGEVRYINGLPTIFAQAQGGLLDVATPKNYQQGDWIYFTHSKQVDGRAATTLSKAHITGTQLTDWQDVLVTQSFSTNGQHYGSRIAFDDAGYLYFSIGDRGLRADAQNLSNHTGSIIRLHIDGRVPVDNPFVNQPNALPEIWSYGHRNPQGLVWDEENNRLWSIEHGPRGGDEINLIEKGKNYGWPIISKGKEYWGPFAVGESTHKKGMEQAVKYYVPSIAPGSLMLYSGDAFPAWQGSLFAGALKLRHLNRVSIDDSAKAIAEERLLTQLDERMRALVQSPKGYIYFSTDSGKIYSIKP